MKYLLIVHHSEAQFNTLPEENRSAMLAESIQLCHQLDAKGQYIHASPLQPEATAALVRMRDGTAIVTDGPFVETKEQLAGYFLLDVRSHDEAVHIAKQVPGARIGTVEVRPLRDISGLPGEERHNRIAE